MDHQARRTVADYRRTALTREGQLRLPNRRQALVAIRTDTCPDNEQYSWPDQVWLIAMGSGCSLASTLASGELSEETRRWPSLSRVSLLRRARACATPLTSAHYPKRVAWHRHISHTPARTRPSTRWP